MKNVIIVHGCPSNREKALSPEKRTYDKHWMPWLKSELENRGIPADVPLMPEPWAPVYEKFKAEFEKQKVTEDTVLVGHSCGGAFLVNWLGETKNKIAKLILVAPWKVNSKGGRARDAFYGFSIDKTIPSRVGEITMFIADDEVKAGKESLEIYRDALGGKLIELKDRGHFTLNDMGTEEFPELLEECLKPA